MGIPKLFPRRRSKGSLGGTITPPVVSHGTASPMVNFSTSGATKARLKGILANGTLGFLFSASSNVSPFGTRHGSLASTLKLLISSASRLAVKAALATGTLAFTAQAIATTTPGIQLGFIPEKFDYGMPQTTVGDIISGSVIEYLDSGGVPRYAQASNLDANNELTSLPAGATAYRRALQQVPVIKPYALTWKNGPTPVSAAAVSVGTLSSFVAGPANGTGSATFTPDTVSTQANPGGGVLTLLHLYCTAASPPTNVHCIPADDTGLISTYHSAHIDGWTTAWAPLRDMKENGIENNSNQTTAFPSITIYPATFKSAVYGADDGSVTAHPTDGVPIAFQVARANAKQRSIWDNVLLNLSDAQIDSRCGVVLNGDAPNGISALDPRATYYWAIGNETWNSGYVNQWSQLGAEYSAEVTAGTMPADTFSTTGGRVNRAIEKTIIWGQRIKAAWDAHVGPKPTLCRMFEMANVLADTADAVLNFSTTNTGGSPLKDNIELLSCAVYATPPFDNISSVPYTTYTVAQVLEFMKQNFLEDLARAKQIRDAAAVYGLRFGLYEFGTQTFYSDDAFHAALYADPGMYNLYLFMLQQLEMAFPGDPVCTSFEVTPLFRFGPPGLAFYGAQGVSATQKGAANYDFVRGIRKLLPQTYSTPDIIISSATNGMTVATAVRTVASSTFALADNDGGKFAIDPSSGVVTLVDKTLFSGATEVRSYTVRELSAKDPAGHLDSVMSYNAIGVGTGTMDINISAGTQVVNGVSYGSLAALPGYGYARANSLSVLTSTGTLSTFAADVLPVNDLGLHSYVGLVNRVESDDRAFENWTLNSTTVTANTTTAPDGTISADTVTASVAGANFILHAANTAGGQDYTVSFFCKRGTNTDYMFSIRDWLNATWTILQQDYFAQTNTSAFTRISQAFTATGPINVYMQHGVPAGTGIFWLAQVIDGNFGCGGPVLLASTSTPDLHWTWSNGEYNLTYVFDDGSTQVVHQIVTGNKFTVATAPTLHRGRITRIHT